MKLVNLALSAKEMSVDAICIQNTSSSMVDFPINSGLGTGLKSSFEFKMVAAPGASSHMKIEDQFVLLQWVTMQ